jgi:hypothetical protein
MFCDTVVEKFGILFLPGSTGNSSDFQLGVC